jgi:hypothetical protein
MEQINQQNRKKDTKGDVMPFLMIVLTFCAVSLIHFLPIFGSIFLAYCAALWYLGIKENNIQLFQDGVPPDAKNPTITETSHEHSEKRLTTNITVGKVISKVDDDRASQFVFRLVPPSPPTRKHIQITLSPKLLQSPAK